MNGDKVFKIVKEQLDKYDAYGLLASGCPADEFDLEAGLITGRLRKGMGADAIAEIIAAVMNGQFENIFKPEEFKNAANEIKNALDFEEKP